jgi:hypothetical protein
VIPRPIGGFRLLSLSHLPLLAAADGREDVHVHIRIDSGGISATIETNQALVMLMLHSGASADDTDLAVCVSCQELARASLQALSQIRMAAGLSAGLMVSGGQLHVLDVDRTLAQVDLLDLEPIDRRAHIAQLLMFPRVPAIGEYPLATIRGILRITGLLELNLHSPVTAESEQLDCAQLRSHLQRAPAIHWSDHVVAIIQPRSSC